MLFLSFILTLSSIFTSSSNDHLNGFDRMRTIMQLEDAPAIIWNLYDARDEDHIAFEKKGEKEEELIVLINGQENWFETRLIGKKLSKEKKEKFLKDVHFYPLSSSSETESVVAAKSPQR